MYLLRTIGGYDRWKKGKLRGGKSVIIFFFWIIDSFKLSIIDSFKLSFIKKIPKQFRYILKIIDSLGISLHCIDTLFHWKSTFFPNLMVAGYTPNLKTYFSDFGRCGLYTGAGNTLVITVLKWNCRFPNWYCKLRDIIENNTSCHRTNTRKQYARLIPHKYSCPNNELRTQGISSHFNKKAECKGQSNTHGNQAQRMTMTYLT